METPNWNRRRLFEDDKELSVSLNEIRKKFLANELIKADYIDQMHVLHRQLFDYAAYLPNTDIAKIEISDGRVVMTSRTDGIKILCDSEDKRIAPIEILNFLRYEKEDSEMVFRLVGDGDTVFDVGANVGWYSIGLAKRYPSCKIYSFEPIPKTFGYLKENVAANGVKNVQVFQQGFSDKTSELTFYYYPEGSGNASLARLADASSVQEIRCKVQKLDEFMLQLDAQVDFIKCDVEGAELLVFQGGLQTLKKQKPIVFSEILRKWSSKFNYNPNEIIKLFASIGYRCFTAHEGKLLEFKNMDESTLETNFYFLEAEKHSEKIKTLTK